MRTVIYWILLASLMAGCASAGQAGIERNKVIETAAPAKTKLTTQPATMEPATPPTAGGVVLSAYDSSQKGYTLRPVNPATGEAVLGHMPLPDKKAKDLGANALVFVQGRIYFATNPTSPLALTQPSRRPSLSPLQTRSILRSRKWSKLTR